MGLLIDIAGIPRSTYYYYGKLFENPKPDKYAEIKELIRKIYDESKGRYGYRRITKELRKTYKINHKTVQRLMRKIGIFCRVRMKKYNSFRGEVGRIAPNLLERDFKANKPNQKWVTDVTELLYLQQFDSVEHFISKLHAYIEWYSTKRIKLKLDGMSPLEYRRGAA